MGGPFQISSQGSVGHVSDTETVQNEWLDESPEFVVLSGSQPPPVDGPQTPAPVERSLLGLVDEPTHQTPVLQQYWQLPKRLVILRHQLFFLQSIHKIQLLGLWKLGTIRDVMNLMIVWHSNRLC